jgi:hypothetical protein
MADNEFEDECFCADPECGCEDCDGDCDCLEEIMDDADFLDMDWDDDDEE